MAGGINGYDSYSDYYAELARRRAEEEARKRAEEEARKKAEKEAAEKAAKEAQKAKEAKAAEEAEETRIAEERQQSAQAESIWEQYEAGDISESEMASFINELADEYEFGPTAEAQEYLTDAQQEEEDNIPDGLKKMIEENYPKMDLSELSNPEFDKVFKEYFKTDLSISEYYERYPDHRYIGINNNFLPWYNYSYKPVNDTRHEAAAVHTFDLVQNIPVPTGISQYELDYSFITSADYYIASGHIGGFNLSQSDDGSGLMRGVEDYKSNLRYDKNGNAVSTITYKKDGKLTTVTTVFDGNSTQIKSQTQQIGDDTTTVKYNEDGSFVVTYPDGTDKTSAEITLARINSYGKTLDEDMAGNNELSELLVRTETAQKAFKAITIYCGGDKNSARIIFNTLYSQDGINVDENFVLRNNKNEELTEESKNPLYRMDQTDATARLFDYRAQDRVLSSEILRAFSTTSKKAVQTLDEENNIVTTYEGTLVVDGVDTGFPESGTEYYIDAQGNLCLNKYTMSSDEDLNLYMTSVVTNTADDSDMYTETVLYYIDANGQQRVSVVREDKDGNQTSFDESVAQYQKRIVVERNYSPDTDGNNVSELNLSTEQINQMYSLMMKDSQYAEIIKTYGYELNSQGFFDHIHTFLVKVFDPKRINTDKLTQEIINTTSMVPVMENFITGNTDEALEATQQEFERRIRSAKTIEEVYTIAQNYYGNDDTAFQFVDQYIQNNSDILDVEADDPEDSVIAISAHLVRGENGISVEYTYKQYFAGIGTGTASLSQPLLSGKWAKLGMENFTAQQPADFESLYTFWTNGGHYNTETITAYNQASTEYSAYNEGLMSAQYMEEALFNANSPEKVFDIFRQNSESDEEALANFNDFYNNIFAKGAIPVSDTKTPYKCTGINAHKNTAGEIVFDLKMTDPNGNPVSADEFDVETVLLTVNDYIKSNQILEKQFSLKYKEEYLSDLEIPEGKDPFKFITQHVNNEYFNAYENLYGNTELKNILGDYITDMNTYASKLTTIVQMGAIGLSFVCPAFGVVAMAAGFLDNAIDLVNMATNKHADNYGDWLKQTGFEIFCVVGGMALGGLCNRIGGKVTEALLTDSNGTAHALRAQILGTATEVGLDITTGMAFDYATNLAFYGEADWNLNGNMFSGLLDIISGVRGYHALKSSLDMSSITVGAAGLSTLLIADASGKQVEFKCAGVDPSGRYIYSDGTGRVIAFDDFNDFGIKPSDVTARALGDVSDNPYVVNRIMQEGLVYDPANNCYRSSDGKVVTIETKVDANGSTYIKETVPGESYSRIIPADNVRQGNDSNCGFLAALNSELRTQEGVDSMFDAVREYPDGSLRVATPDGQEIKLDAKPDADGNYNLSDVYREAITKATDVSGGFADDIAKGMGLNPVRVEPGADGTFTRGQLDNMAQMVANGDSLSVGVRYSDGTGHYMTVQEVDPETGNMRVYDSATGETKTINVNDTDGNFKVEEISGGSTGEVKPGMNTPRPDGSAEFGAAPQTSTSEVDPYHGKIDDVEVVEVSSTGRVETIMFEDAETATRTYSAGRTVTQYDTPDGRFVVEYSDGKTAIFSPDDNTLTYPNDAGEIVTIDTTNKYVSVDPDTGEISIKDGKSKPSVISYMPHTTYKNNPNIFVNADGSYTIRSKAEADVNGTVYTTIIPDSVAKKLSPLQLDKLLHASENGICSATGQSGLKREGVVKSGSHRGEVLFGIKNVKNEAANLRPYGYLDPTTNTITIVGLYNHTQWDSFLDSILE